jgi:hypothetical protein
MYMYICMYCFPLNTFYFTYLIPTIFFSLQRYIPLPEISARSLMIRLNIGDTPHKLTDQDFNRLGNYYYFLLVFCLIILNILTFRLLFFNCTPFSLSNLSHLSISHLSIYISLSLLR